jgi:hypothetical protein
MKIFTTAIGLVFMIVVWGGGALWAEVYTWTDENGVKHFSDQPPENAKGAKPAFSSYEYDEAADKQRTENDSKELKKIVTAIDNDYEKEQQEKMRLQEEAEANRPPTMEERVATERERLNQKIAELEAQPLEFFGSQRNKINTIGYYKYRLGDLAKDPEKYFSEPTRFEGNVRHPADE